MSQCCHLLHALTPGMYLHANTGLSACHLPACRTVCQACFTRFYIPPCIDTQILQSGHGFENQRRGWLMGLRGCAGWRVLVVVCCCTGVNGRFRLDVARERVPPRGVPKTQARWTQPPKAQLAAWHHTPKTLAELPTRPVPTKGAAASCTLAALRRPAAALATACTGRAAVFPSPQRTPSTPTPSCTLRLALAKGGGAR
jgi:hypothetical protein